MKRGLRSPSLFWTFAGWFLLVLVLVAVLQGLVAVAVVEPLNQAWRRDRSELLARRAANEIARDPAALDRANANEIAAGILDTYASQARAQSLILVLRRPDGEIVFDHLAPPRVRQRVTALIDRWLARDASDPSGSSREPGWEPPPRRGRPDIDSFENRRPGRRDRREPSMRVLYRHEATPLLGEVIAIQDVRRLPFGPAAGLTRLLLFLPLALIVAAVAALLLFRTQVRRLRALETLAARVTEGDLDARVVDVQGDELGRLGERLNRMTESLAIARNRERESDRQRRQLLADISHELATPLTSIRGYAETLLNREVAVSPDERTAYVRSILGESERLGLLTRDLFELARLETGAVPLTRVDLDWSELCRHTVERFRPRFEAAGLTVSWSVSAPPAWVSADGHRLEQVVENLLANALRYVPAGGRVEAALVSSDVGHVLTVEDDGPGIPEQDLPHVFDRFFRADPARARPGSGLGLAIVREIVERHGGSVRAENRHPHGAAFIVELPAAGTSPARGA